MASFLHGMLSVLEFENLALIRSLDKEDSLVFIFQKWRLMLQVWSRLMKIERISFLILYIFYVVLMFFYLVF